LNRRARMKTGVLAVAGIGVLAIGGYAIHVQNKAPPPGALNINVPMIGSDGHNEQVVHETRPLDAPSRVAVAAVDARAEVAAPRDAHAMVTVAIPDAHELAAAPPDAAALETTVEITVLGNSSYRIDMQGNFNPIADRVLRLTVKHPIDVEIKNPFAQTATVHLQPGDKNLVATQPFLPVSVTPICAVPDATVTIDGQFAVLGQQKILTFDQNASWSGKKIVVVFSGGKTGKPDEHPLDLKAGQVAEVKCDLH
ncbi:MAG TPA: hypothetical protein VFQ65_28245, partial [Kofleriaceae bacterium]|nr:hypothetical protein [Kofleriaceae bacterium]